MGDFSVSLVIRDSHVFTGKILSIVGNIILGFGKIGLGVSIGFDSLVSAIFVWSDVGEGMGELFNFCKSSLDITDLSPCIQVDPAVDIEPQVKA